MKSSSDRDFFLQMILLHMSGIEDVSLLLIGDKSSRITMSEDLCMSNHNLANYSLKRLLGFYVSRKSRYAHVCSFVSLPVVGKNDLTWHFLDC